MKKKLDRALLLALVLGAVGLLLNLAVVLKGHDSTGLAKAGYLPGILLVLLGLGGIAALVWQLWRLKGQRKYLRLFTASLPTAAALAALALALTVTNFCDLVAGNALSKLDTWRSITGLAGGLGLLLCAWCRYQGSRPVWLCWALVTAHLILLLVADYRIWSRATELTDYAFQLLALVLLMLAAYHQAAADAGVGNLREYLIFSTLCVFLCPIAMIGSEMWLELLFFWLYHSINLYSLHLKGA